jgi:hypothetical protein
MGVMAQSAPSGSPLIKKLKLGVEQKFPSQLTIKIGEGKKPLYIWAHRFPEYY